MQDILRCPHCNQAKLIKAGHQLKSGIGQVQQYRCKADGCGRTTTSPIYDHRDDKGRFTSPNAIGSVVSTVANKETTK
jgi:transposase-like protein